MAIPRFSSHGMGFAGGIVLAAAVFALGAHVLDFSQFLRSAWANALWTAAAAVVTWQCLLTARYVDPIIRIPWYAFALGGTLWTAGMLVWSWHELVLGNFGPFPSLADVGFIAYPICMVLGFLSLPTRQRLAFAALWKVATLTVFVSTVCFIFATLLFSGPGDAATGSRNWIALAGPVTHFLAFLYAAFLALQFIGTPIFRVLILIVASLAVFAAVNMPYALAVIGTGYQVGNTYDPLWLVALGLMVWAAADRRRYPPGSQQAIRFGLLWEVTIPALCGIVAILVLAVAIERFDPAGAPYLVFFAILYLVGAALQKYCLLRSEQQRAADASAANAALRENETRSRDLAELTADWFWETDMKQRFTYLTPSNVYEGAGLSAQAWIGKSRLEMHSELTGPSLAEEVQLYMDRGLAFHDIRRRFTHPEHGESWLSISGKPIRDEAGEMVGYRGIGRNVTAEERAKRKLKEQEQLLRLVIDNVPLTIYLKDLEGRFLLANRRQMEFFKLRQEQILGRTLGELFGADWAADYARQDREVIEHGEIRHYEVRVPMAEGERCLHVTKFPVFDADGNFVAIGGINTDITEQRALEGQLRQAQRLEAVGQLTGGVAHDFNNLLAVILGNAEMLTEQLEERPDLRELGEAVAAAAERGAELTQRLLAFSRQQGLQPRTVDVNALITGFEKLLDRTLGERIEIETRFAEDLWPAHADPGQLENAILNLALNARDAMPDGGKLVIETANAELDTSYKGQDEEFQPGPYVAISVSDSGEGMPPEVLEKAFEPFFTTKEVGKGSGLGLSMVYGFLKQSGGLARLYSEPGYGTTVKLYLPAARGTRGEAAEAVQASGAAAPRGRETVLVVEDNPSVRQNVVAQIESLGYATLEAEDGTAALEILEDGAAFDLLFTDMIMPGGVHGYDLVKQALDLRPGLRVVMTTGFSDLTRFDLAKELLEMPVLRKPYRRSELAETLRRALDMA